MTEQFKNELQAILTKYDGHVTNGSLEEAIALIERELARSTNSLRYLEQKASERPR